MTDLGKLMTRATVITATIIQIKTISNQFCFTL
jgi:hypothetical protein